MKKIIIISLSLFLLGGCVFWLRESDAFMLQGVVASHTSVAAGTDVSDNFDRANANPIGGNWTTITSQSVVQIVNNQAVGTSTSVDSVAYWSANSFSATQCSRVTLGTDGAGMWAGPIVRAQTGSNSFYKFVTNQGIDYFYSLINNGSETVLGSHISSFPATGDVVTLCISGTTLTAYINGAAQSTRTDSTLSSGYAGMTLTNTYLPLDNWAGWDGVYK